MMYIVGLNGRRFEVELEGDRVRVDGGVERIARLTALPGTPARLVTVGEESTEVHRVMARRDGARGSYVLRVDGRRYQAEALDERAYAIRGLAGTAEAVTGPQLLLAPMAGLIVQVRVAPGDRVEAGQSIVVIEAMKMENELRAPIGGVLRSVSARAGAAVKKGAVLAEIEPPAQPAVVGTQAAVPGTQPVDTP